MLKPAKINQNLEATQRTTAEQQEANKMTFSTTSSSSQPSPSQQPALPKGYTLHPGYPSVPDYLHLRAASGLSPKTAAQAAPVASGSWHGCYITFTGGATADQPATAASAGGPGQGQAVAMGRVIGDGGWYFHIADMAVLPEHQRKGLGDAILKHLVAHIRAKAPAGEGAEPYVTLLADEPGRRLYRRHGFVETMPGSLGMMLPMKGPSS